MAGWNIEGLPHKGWRYSGMEDVGEGVYLGGGIKYQQCDMCGEKIRYVHI